LISPRIKLPSQISGRKFSTPNSIIIKKSEQNNSPKLKISSRSKLGKTDESTFIADDHFEEFTHRHEIPKRPFESKNLFNSIIGNSEIGKDQMGLAVVKSTQGESDPYSPVLKFDQR